MQKDCIKGDYKLNEKQGKSNAATEESGFTIKQMQTNDVESGKMWTRWLVRDMWLKVWVSLFMNHSA